jgi:hypothetical protein
MRPTNLKPVMTSLEPRRLLAAGYQIELQFAAGTPTSVQQAAQAAKSKWESVITGDVPDVGSGAWGGPVDDLRVLVSVVSIDGAGGGVARTRPTYVRDGSSLPIYGEVQFDSADLNSLVANSILTSTAIHEMAHAIGFGSLWVTKGLVSTAQPGNPVFTGTLARAEFRTLSNDPNATGVPIENIGGTGTIDQHWRRSTFGNELMNGFIVPGTMPLSRVSIAMFADLGYTVNMAAANSYSLPTVNVAGTVRSSTTNAGMSGRTVFADSDNDGALDAFEKRATTDASGAYTLTGLTPRTYNIRQVLPSGSTQTSPAGNAPVAVTIAFGGASQTANFVATPVGSSSTPAAPTGLVAAVASSSQINLAWKDNATNETGYRIQRATNGAFTTGLTTINVGPNVKYYANVGLAAGTTYYYRVYAVNGSTLSAPSNVASRTTTGGVGGTAPIAPSGLIAATASRSQINLAWKDNATNETAYRIERATSSGGAWTTIATLGPNVKYFQSTGLLANTTYYYRVIALNGSSGSTPSNVASGKTLA